VSNSHPPTDRALSSLHVLAAVFGQYLLDIAWVVPVCRLVVGVPDARPVAEVAQANVITLCDVDRLRLVASGGL
jgi:hypothetical protein